MFTVGRAHDGELGSCQGGRACVRRIFRQASLELLHVRLIVLLPVMSGVIERRLLVNYRVAPGVLARVLPAPFRPQLVHGWGIAGICLIGLRAVRPRGLPAAVGLSSENAAHRIAVEWDDHGVIRSGVYIPRRDTNSRVTVAAGGRLFPGVHHRARFTIHEADNRVSVALVSDDGATRVQVSGRASTGWPAESVFPSVDAASAFFERGALGYSEGRHPNEHDGLELQTMDWRVQALAVESVDSSYFEDRTVFPEGSVAFDCALLMREVAHEWHARGALRADDPLSPARLRSVAG